MSGVAERLAQIKARIGEASRRAGRAVGDVVLVGASKLQPVPVLAS